MCRRPGWFCPDRRRVNGYGVSSSVIIYSLPLAIVNLYVVCAVKPVTVFVVLLVVLLCTSTRNGSCSTTTVYSPDPENPLQDNSATVEEGNVTDRLGLIVGVLQSSMIEKSSFVIVKSLKMKVRIRVYRVGSTFCRLCRPGFGGGRLGARHVAGFAGRITALEYLRRVLRRVAAGFQVAGRGRLRCVRPVR